MWAAKAAFLHPAAGRGQRCDRHRRCDGLCHGCRFPERRAAEPEPRPRRYGPDRDAGTAAERFCAAGRWCQRAGRRHCAGAGGAGHPERQFRYLDRRLSPGACPLTQMQTALNGISASTDELNTLLDASTQIRDGIARLDEGAAQLEQQVSFEAYKAILKENGLDLDVVKDGNAKAIQQLQGMVWMMPQLKDVILLLQGSTANIDAMQTYLDTVNGGIAQLHEGSSTLNGSYGEFDAGVRQLAGVLTGMLGNLSVLTDGVNQLAAQYVQLDDGLNAYTDGVAQLKAGVAQLAEGASQLTGGTGELRSSVSGIDMGAQLDGLLNSLSGGGEVQSFTSAENTEVGAVQFALQTTAITAPAPAFQPEPAAVTLTFWQKLLKLFGLYKG